MTVIVYRDGVMASDSGVFNGGRVMPWSRKVARGPDGTLYGVSGDAAPSDLFLDWVLDGCVGEPPCKPEKESNSECSTFTILVVGPDGVPRVREWNGEERYPDAPYWAMGSAAAAALGALFAGATAERAVGAALMHEVNARGPVQVVRFDAAS